MPSTEPLMFQYFDHNLEYWLEIKMGDKTLAFVCPPGDNEGPSDAYPTEVLVFQGMVPKDTDRRLAIKTFNLEETTRHWVWEQAVIFAHQVAINHLIESREQERRSEDFALLCGEFEGRLENLQRLSNVRFERDIAQVTEDDLQTLRRIVSMISEADEIADDLSER